MDPPLSDPESSSSSVSSSLHQLTHQYRSQTLQDSLASSHSQLLESQRFQSEVPPEHESPSDESEEPLLSSSSPSNLNASTSASLSPEQPDNLSDSPVDKTEDTTELRLQDHSSGSLAVTTERLPPTPLPEKEKITIRFQAIGGAPPISVKVFKISRNQKFSVLNKFLHKRVYSNRGNRSSPEPEGRKQLFLYLHNSFAPNGDEVLGNLFSLFKVGDELIVSYCLNVAFG